MTDPSLYADDVVTWADRQVAELRRLAASGISDAVDWANVIEEIESVGRSEWLGVRSQLANALAHVIKGLSDPNSLSAEAWRREVGRMLGDARDDYRPSMRGHLEMEAIWRRAFRHASEDLEPYGIGVPPGIPVACPFTLDELLAPAFQYEDGRRRLHDIIVTRNTGDML